MMTDFRLLLSRNPDLSRLPLPSSLQTPFPPVPRNSSILVLYKVIVRA